jgi:NAD(P)-dependent dehydrogenase (short-subunit alcohol dehydrogenase family)
MTITTPRASNRTAGQLWLAAPLVALVLAACTPSAWAERGPVPTSGDSPTKKTVLITGANRGLGLEFARQYQAAGWHVIGTARAPESATDLRALEVRVMQLDVADPASVERLAGGLAGQPVDLLINNAGIFPRVSTLEETDFGDVARTLEVNTIGPMRVTLALLPNLRRAETRQIISITSGLGSIANNSSGRYYGYRESKAALNMFTRSLAVELQDEGFTCVVMSPGWVRTDMGGPNATLSPEESISGMRAVIERLQPSDSGNYWNYDGQQLPW